MIDDEKPEADVQEQQQPGPGNPRQGPPPPDADDADAQEQGDLQTPPSDPTGESLEERLDKATKERSGDEPA